MNDNSPSQDRQPIRIDVPQQFAEHDDLGRIFVEPTGSRVSVVLRPIPTSDDDEGQSYDPGIWGIVLADMINHVAIMYERAFGFPRNKTIQRVREIFEAEQKTPTDTPRGAVFREGDEPPDADEMQP